ncbi:MAG: HAMP domain-containing protein, partial [Crocinitomicaceae bacterium]|nr:HAMP domain-containing protein [Crocinitomicaceae bacterium]
MHEVKQHKKSPQDTSIKQKLLAIIMTVSSVALTASSILVILFAMASFKKHLAEELSSQTKMIAYNCSAAVHFNDETDVASILESLREHPATAYAHVSNIDHSILATYRRKGFDADPQDTPTLMEPYNGNEWALAAEPITVDGKKIGTVFIQSDLSRFLAFQKQMILVVTVIFITILLVTFLLSSTLQKRISEPIEHLTRTAKKVSESRDYSLRAIQTSNDEIGLLTDAFNNMLSEIEHRDSNLQQKDFVIHSSSTAITTTDLNGLLTYVNPAFLSMWA